MNKENVKLVLISLQIRCPFCNFISRYNTGMIIHISRKHSDDDADKYIKNYNKIKDIVDFDTLVG